MYGHATLGKSDYLVEVEDSMASNDPEVANEIDKNLFGDLVQSEIEPPMEMYDVLVPKGTKPSAPFVGKISAGHPDLPPHECTLLCPQEDELPPGKAASLSENDTMIRLPVPLDIRD